MIIKIKSRFGINTQIFNVNLYFRVFSMEIGKLYLNNYLRIKANELPILDFI